MPDRGPIFTGEAGGVAIVVISLGLFALGFWGFFWTNAFHSRFFKRPGDEDSTSLISKIVTSPEHLLGTKMGGFFAMIFGLILMYSLLAGLS